MSDEEDSHTVVTDKAISGENEWWTLIWSNGNVQTTQRWSPLNLWAVDLVTIP